MLQGRLADHRLAFRIPNEAAGRVGPGQHGSARRSDTESEDEHALFLRLLRQTLEVAFQILAVAENDQRPLARSGLIHCFQGRFDGRGEAGAADGQTLRVDSKNGLADGVVVVGQRSQGKSRAREGEDADAVVGNRAQQIQGRQFRRLEAVGGGIGREHAARGVDRDEDVAGARHLDHRFLAELRPGQGEGEQE